MKLFDSIKVTFSSSLMSQAYITPLSIVKIVTILENWLRFKLIHGLMEFILDYENEDQLLSIQIKVLLHADSYKICIADISKLSKHWTFGSVFCK